MKNDKVGLIVTSFLVLGAAFLAGCGGASTSTNSAVQSNQGKMVIMGTDFPTTSNVISFVVPISSITLSDNGGAGVSVLNSPTSINFSQLVGLRSLITAQTATPGTYTSATITFNGDPTLSILDTTANPPAVPTLKAAFTSPSVTVNFPTNTEGNDDEKISTSTALGMVLDFHLDKSIPVDSSGNIVETSGVVEVNPVISVHFLHADSDKFDLDELRGGIVSVGTDGTFVIETRNRSQFTIATDSNTKFEPSGQSFSSLSTNDLVEIEDAQVDPSTLQVHAREVDVFPDKFMVSGLVTYENPPATANATTCPSTVSLLVRDVLPADATSSISQDQITNVPLAGSEKYFFVHEQADLLSGFSTLPFNSCSIVPGQALTIGGTLSGSTLTPASVMLAKQGFSGSVASILGAGAFTFNARGLAGVLLPSPVTVETLLGGEFNTDVHDDSAGVATGLNLHVAGLVLFNTSTNTTNILALRLVQPEQP